MRTTFPHGLNEMLRLLGCGSPNVAKVMIMLAETGLAYSFEEVPLYDGTLDGPQFRALNPNGRLPVLVDDGSPVFESGAILIHLAEKTGKFLPARTPDRGRVLQWLMWQMAGVGPMFGQALHFRYIAPPGTIYARERYDAEVQRLYDVAEDQLARECWLAGDDYSIADMAAYPWLGRYAKTLGVDLAGRPHVRRWIDAVRKRPAMAEVEEAVKAMFKRGLAEKQAATPEQLDRFFGR